MSYENIHDPYTYTLYNGPLDGMEIEYRELPDMGDEYFYLKIPHYKKPSDYLGKRFDVAVYRYNDLIGDFIYCGFEKKIIKPHHVRL